MDLSVVVPTRNERDNVAELVSQLDEALVGYDFEVIFVDDSDPQDGTPSRIREVSSAYEFPVSVLHRDPAERPGGLGGAVVMGLRAAKAPWAVVCDGDLQHPPDLVPALHRRGLAEQVDLVVASRYLGEGSAGGLDGGGRRAVSKGTGALAKSLFPVRLRGCTDPMSGFFAIRTAAVDLDLLRPRGFKILLELLTRARLSVAEVPFTFGHRHAGRSKASLAEGLRFLRQLVALRCDNPALWFALVGASGVAPNVAGVALLTGLGVHYGVAAVLATQAAILWNFAGCELIVFKDRRAGRLLTRGAKFAVFGELDLLRLPFVVLLVHYTPLGAVLATLLTIVASFLLRFQGAARAVYPLPDASAEAPVRLLEMAR